MPNPFEDESATYLVLANSEEQHSLWPQDINVPQGWQVVFGPAARGACLAYINENWTDLRPKSLVRIMAADGP